jgi:thioredoxin reductase
VAEKASTEEGLGHNTKGAMLLHLLLQGGRATAKGVLEATELDGAHLDRLTAMLGRIGAELVDVHGRVANVARVDGGLDLTLDDGEMLHVGSMFIAPTFGQSAPFAEQLGLELNDSGCIRVDAFQATSVPGVFAAGDAAHVPALPMPMSSIITSQAAGMVAGAACVQHLLGRDSVRAG